MMPTAKLSSDDWRKALDESVEAWTDQSLCLPKILKHWRGRPAAQQSNQITMVACAKWALSLNPPNSEAVEYLQSKAEVLVRHNQPFFHACLQEKTLPPLLRSRALASAISHTVLAAVHHRSHRTDTVQTHIREASKCYESAWDIGKAKLEIQDPPNWIEPGKNRLPSKVACEILSFLESKETTATTWLILHELLTEILGGKILVKHSNQLKMLMVDPYLPDGEIGCVLPITVRRIKTPILAGGFYPDPLSFGITQLSKSMRQSMLAAWRCCLGSNDGKIDIPELTLRIDSHFGDLPYVELEGASAGGLLAASMIATAAQRTLCPECSATCRLELCSDQLGEESDLLDSDDVHLGKIDGVVAKAREAWIGHGVDEVFVCPDNLREWEDANRQGPKATPVKTLTELLNGLDRDRPHLDLLESIRQKQHKRWEHIIADQGKPRTDRDHDHRLDLYVPPSLMVEGPKISSAQIGESLPEQTLKRDCEEIQVPGEPLTDSILSNVLKLALQEDFELPTSEWAQSPAWLRGGCDLLLYDSAGSGKSVCTLRMLHLLSDKKLRAELWHDPFSWLVVRFEGQWQRAGSELVSLRDQVAYVITQQQERFGDEELKKLRAAVDFAFRRQRVVVIIDGFDQLKTEERLHVVAQRNSDDGLRCRWIIASREHTIATLFDSERSFREWTKVRIDPFENSHQDAYYKKAGLAAQWHSYVDRGTMGELLQLPYVLALLRTFIESSPPGDLTEADLPHPKAVFESFSQLAIVTARMLLDSRALPDDKRGGIARVPDLSRADELETLEHVLSLIAFQMMLNGEMDGRVAGGANVRSLIDECEARYFWELDEEERTIPTQGAANRLNRTHASKVERRQACWDWALQTLRAIELSHREVLEHNDADMLAFRSRKSMEYYAARYITKFANRRDVFGDETPAVNSPPQTSSAESPCLWDHITDEQWEDTWRIAIEMPQTSLPGCWGTTVVSDAVIDHAVTCQSLSVLFRLPKPNSLSKRRPTELLWKCWPLFEYDEQRTLDCRFRDGSKIVSGHDLAADEKKEWIKQVATSNQLGERSGNAPVIEQRKGVLEEFRESSRELALEFEKRFDKVLLSDGSRVPIPSNEQDRLRVLSEWQTQSSWEKSRTMIQCPPQAWIEELDSDPRVNDAIEGHESEAIRPIRIQATPVTRGMYQMFDEAIPMNEAIAPSFIGLDPTDFPVVQVNWYDAWVFCKWVGQRYRLPTEFEWEYACGAGTKTNYHFGNGLNGTQANCNGNYPFGTDANGEELEAGPFLKGCTPVGWELYPSNAYGLLDVHGNVWEWCTGGYDTARGHARRGGSWSSNGGSYRSCHRYWFIPSRRYGLRGFRLAAVPEPS